MRIINLVRDPALARYLEQGEFREPLVIARGTEPRVHLSCRWCPTAAAQRLMLVRDVSHQVALESMRKDFVANASHELRSPLTVVTGYLETLLQDEQLDPALRGPLQEMQRQTQRMNGIVNDLLDLSRLDALAEEAAGEPIDVAAHVRRAAQGRAGAAGASGRSRVEMRQRCATARRRDGDAFGLLEPGGQRRQIHARQRARSASGWRLDDSGQARFAVHDTGPGIAPEHLPRLTERFYRVDSGRSRAAGGAGLGLAIVKHVLQHHGAITGGRRARPEWAALSPVSFRRGACWLAAAGATIPTPVPVCQRVRHRRTSMETADLSHHISRRFNEDLERVRTRVLAMGGLVEELLGQGASTP